MKIDDVRKLSDLMGDQTENGHRHMMERLAQMGIDPSNIYQEIEMSSRYVDTHQDVSYGDTPVNLHSHSYYEFLYCRTSAGMEYLIGSDRYRIQHGDIIYVPPGISHRPILPETLPEPYVRDVIWASQEFMEGVVQLFADGQQLRNYPIVPFRTAGTRWDFIGELFRNGVREAERRDTGWETAVVGNTLMIFAQLRRAFAQQDEGRMKKEKRELLDEITAYIESNYAGHITLHDVAKQFYVSESTVSHLFKQKMGVSLYHYVTQRRLIAAKNRILEGISMEEVAEQVGFSDYSTFYRAFKGEYGISPRQFRNQNIK